MEGANETEGAVLTEGVKLIEGALLTEGVIEGALLTEGAAETDGIEDGACVIILVRIGTTSTKTLAKAPYPPRPLPRASLSPNSLRLLLSTDPSCSVPSTCWTEVRMPLTLPAWENPIKRGRKQRQ